MAQPSQTSSEQSEQSTDRRVSVVEAATILSITPDAVRSRLRRGTLRKDRGPDGEVLVVLDGDASSTDCPTDQPTVALIEALEEQITYLREQAALWQEEARRKDHLLAAALEAAALERTPALEEPSEPREERVMDSEEPYSTHAPPMPETPISDAQHKRKVSWWRAFFGLE
jgi:hypothetical protein